MSPCPVESSLSRHMDNLDNAEAKTERIKKWLKDSGRVVDAIEKSMRTDGDFDEYASEHDDGFALIQLGLLSVRGYLKPDNFDPDWLKRCANRVCNDFIRDQYELFEAKLIDENWSDFDD